ncbi:hypothetical protein OpiT1DRAFT_00791 [Opitutaceae bacterium TAV1]|nr:hypothetical protein OpiT1DRAFT_00791 [Opitutaceae bacterium TAV1]
MRQPSRPGQRSHSRAVICGFPVLLLVAMLGLSGVLAGCGLGQPPPVPSRQIIDAPRLAESLKWVGSCAVLCSLLGGVALVIASGRRRK